MRQVVLCTLLGAALVSTGLMAQNHPVQALGSGFIGGSRSGEPGMYGASGRGWEPSMGGRGMHGLAAMGRNGMRGSAPAFVVITIDKVMDADKLRASVAALSPALASFSGRLTVDADKPSAWDGTAAQHIAMIQFDSPQQAEAWHQSDAFKSFDVDLRKTATATVQFTQGLAMQGGPGRGHGRRGFDMRAFQPFVKKNDALLGKLKGICTGC